jgi:4-amino-4-deoxy-L-arabinose transferase-like glycosyltransferase
LFRRLAAPASLLALCAALLLYGLDRPLLWVDEAETALLARSILVNGIPKARVGRDLISQEIGREFGPDLVWRWTPWLDKYVAAGSFALLGEGTLAARLPFALIGLAAVASVYSLALGLFADRRIALLAMAFLGTSVPFLLHARQCRYYPIAILGTIWAVHFAAATLRRAGWRAPAGLALAMTVVFHANYLTFVALGTALVGTFWILGIDRSGFLRLIAAGAVTAAVNFPWLVFFDVLGKSAESPGFNPDFLLEYSALTLRYSFPAAAVLVFAALALATRHRAILAEWRVPVFLALMPFFYLPVLCFDPLRFYRYSVNLLPVFALLMAWMSVRAWSMQRVAGAVFGASLLVTGVFHEISALPTRYAGANTAGATFPALDWAFPLGNFLYELANPFEGSMGTATKYLAANARPGDRVYVSYGDLTARFYLTKLEVRGGQSGESLAGWGPPEWIFVRGFFRFIGRTIKGSDAQATLDWLDAIPWDQYMAIDLTIPDLAWESIPEPQWHWFRKPPIVPHQAATISWHVSDGPVHGR